MHFVSEEDYYYHKVFTLHKCNDHMQNDTKDENTNLNRDCNTKQVIKDIVAEPTVIYQRIPNN